MSEFTSTTNVTPIYPAFVMHKKWETPEGFNQALYNVAAEDAAKNRVEEEGNEKNVGIPSTYISHLRHNFLVDYAYHPAVKQLTAMVDQACREYLLNVYGYEHEGNLNMMADTFWQREEGNENYGINTHTHIKCDLVVTYYPKITYKEDSELNPFNKGAFRAYDPSNYGKRFWPVKNDNFFIGGWYQVEPEEGSMVILEGYVPHDSTYFNGVERMCIPILVDVETPKQHEKVSSYDIIRS